MSKVHLKHPLDIADYQVDWSDWLAGDTIVASSWSVEPADELMVQSEQHDTNTATAFLHGGSIGRIYKASNQITSADGRTGNRRVVIRVENR